jgi:hypothetical protein
MLPAKFETRPEISALISLSSKQSPEEASNDGTSLHASPSEYIRKDVQDAIGAAVSGHPPSLDAYRLLSHGGSPISFLRLFWTEIDNMALHGETEFEACRRLAVFVLALSPPRVDAWESTPPLLPLFMQGIMPYLLELSTQTHLRPVSMELLIATVASSLTAALHIEWSLRERKGVLPSTGSAMDLTKRLSVDLKRDAKNSPAAKLLLQRLGALPAFVKDFPFFRLEA